MATIGKFANVNTSEHEIMQPFAEKAPAIAKVQIIATEETARAANTLNREITASKAIRQTCTDKREAGPGSITRRDDRWLRKGARPLLE